MKTAKKLVLILIVAALIMSFAACGKRTGDKAYQSPRFKIAEVSRGAEYYTETVFYDIETGVLYLGVRHGDQLAMTVLLNADGTPMLYEDNYGDGA